MRWFITGDTHGDLDRIYNWINRMNFNNFDTNIFIAGDAGICWSPQEFQHFLNLYNDIGCTIIFIDGNHENISLYDRVDVNIDGSPSIRIITRSVAEANVERMNFWVDSCNAAVDYGFTLADVYALEWSPVGMPKPEDEFGNVIISADVIKDVINGKKQVRSKR